MEPRTAGERRHPSQVIRETRRPHSARPLSAGKPTIREILDGFRRSNSAKLPGATEQQQGDAPPSPPIIVLDEEEGHKIGCPRGKKFRCKSKSRLVPSESTVKSIHPKPWGARSVNEIPCYCKGIKVNEEVRKRFSRSPTRCQEFLTRNEKQFSKLKITDIIDKFGDIIDKKKVKLNDYEFNVILEGIKEKLLTVKSNTETGGSGEKERMMKAPEVSPPRRSRLGGGALVPAPRLPSREMMAGEPVRTSGAMVPGGGGGPIFAKTESNKYLFKMGAPEGQVAPELKQFLGMMEGPGGGADGGAQVVLLDEGRYAYLQGAQVEPQYTVLKSAGLLHHQAQNTTLLLGGGIPLSHKAKLPSQHALHTFKSRRL